MESRGTLAAISAYALIPTRHGITLMEDLRTLTGN